MAEVTEIVMNTDNIFIATWHLLQYGWGLWGWWLVMALIIQFLVVVYLYERYVAGTRTWNFW